MDVRGTYFGRTGYVPHGWGLSPGGDCRVAQNRYLKELEKISKK